MQLVWFGQRCCRLESKEGTVLIDPYGKEVSLRGPRLRGDVILSSTGSVPGQPEEESFVVTNPGEYERRGIAIRGIRAYRDEQEGAERGLNTIFVMRIEDMAVCHLGALGQAQLTNEQLDAIGDVDVLIVPVGGYDVMDAKAAVQVVAQVEPKIIVPVQYAMTGSPYRADKVEVFVKAMGLDAEKVEKLKLAKKTLPVQETLLYIVTG
jgi:L-ascorbate metabolism protein UlaG (beta-lactamase superfamily)